jgi:hypothetical protein
LEPELITSLDQINPTWLTKILWRNELLKGGRVAEVSYESDVTSFSVIAIYESHTLAIPRTGSPLREVLKAGASRLNSGGWLGGDVLSVRRARAPLLCFAATMLSFRRNNASYIFC